MVCPVKKFNIGLFGGQTIGKVVLCNAITGETEEYKIKDCPPVGRPCLSGRLID